MKAVKINGVAPEHDLMRIFGKQEHCDAFVNGGLRFSHISNYTKMLSTDTRGDVTEGEANFRQWNEHQRSLQIEHGNSSIKCKDQPGIMNFSGSMLQQAYILCCSKYDQRTEVGALRNRFSDDGKKPQWVEIFDVCGFTHAVAESLAKSKYAQGILELQWREVEYTKGKTMTSGYAPDSELSLYQKPPVSPEGVDYTLEREWRLIVLLRNDPAFQCYLDPSPFQIQDEDKIDQLVCKKIYHTDNQASLEKLSRCKREHPRLYEIWKQGVFLWEPAIEFKAVKNLGGYIKIND